MPGPYNKVYPPLTSVTVSFNLLITPSSLFSGLTIRCLLSQNGLDVDWINPEDEETSVVRTPLGNIPKSSIISASFTDFDEDEEDTYIK